MDEADDTSAHNVRQDLPLIAFNRGIISPLALARTDLKAAMMAAEDQTNYVPRAFGSMMLRPGTEYIDTFTDMESDDNIFLIPFVYDNDDTAIIELFETTSGGKMRVRIDDSLISYPTVSSAISNANPFVSGLTSWTDDDDAGGTSESYNDGTVVHMSLRGNVYAYARRYQEVTVSGGDADTEHAIKLYIASGEVTLSIGSTQGDDDYVTRTVLTKGYHIFSFTPSGNFFIDVASNTLYRTLISTMEVVSGSDLFDIDFTTSISSVKYIQSADVIYFSVGNNYTLTGDYNFDRNYQGRLYKLIRYGSRSWSIVDYIPGDGPFSPYNKTGVSISSNSTTGEAVLTSSANFFDNTHFGSLLSIDSVGQEVQSTLTGADQYTDEIRVFGENRSFNIVRSGTWSATLTLQRSIGTPGAWTDVSTYTVNGTTPYDDGLDNQIIYYRIGIKSGDYTSGSVVATLEYSDGSITGVCRVTGINSATQAAAHVVKTLGGTDGTTNWRLGRWNHQQGFPVAPAIHDSRLFLAGKQYIDGSEVDDYESFDDTIEGDSKPISRSIGYGPMDHINWLASTERLFLGTAASEIQVKASTFESPLTETDFSLKDASTQGSANIAAIKLDGSIIYVGKTGTRLFRLHYDGDMQRYTSTELTALNPEILEEGVVKLVIQRQPDTRIHALLEDGNVAILMQDDIDGVAAWVKYETDGDVLDMVVLPGTEEDRVYYAISRTNGVFLEKWALESECQGGDLNKQADSFVVYDSTATTTPFTTELLHLTGETVVIWADGKYVGTDTVTAGGALTSALSVAASKVVAGKAYTAQFKSAKLAYGSALGTALTKRKKIDQLGLILRNTHCQGIEFGDDFTNMSMIPGADRDEDDGADTIFTEYDADMTRVDTSWSTDSRLCLQSTAPKPCTVLAAIVKLDTRET